MYPSCPKQNAAPLATPRIPRCLPAFATLAAVASMASLTGCASLADPALHGATISRPLQDAAEVTLFAAGDIAQCGKAPVSTSGAARTAAMVEKGIAASPDAVVLALGDTTYPSGLPAEFTDCYGPTWGRFKDRTLPAPGNHEYRTPGAAGYFDYFGALAGPDQRGYYSRTVGMWHVVSLNSNLRSPASEAQVAWLREDLAQLRRSDPKACVLAFWHHPFYSSGGHGNNMHMRGVWQTLLDARADVVLSGHDHDYERFGPQDANANIDTRAGLRQFVVGNGGAELSPYGPTKPHSAAQDNSSHGVIRMVLKPDGYEWAFMSVDGGAPRDVGHAACNGAQITSSK
ncbi:MAG: metallophosphoesterase [Herminiimonas sp.]|nr:metallophosphoesterase [Herminiimonas sp.]